MPVAHLSMSRRSIQLSTHKDKDVEAWDLLVPCSTAMREALCQIVRFLYILLVLYLLVSSYLKRSLRVLLQGSENCSNGLVAALYVGIVGALMQGSRSPHML